MKFDLVKHIVQEADETTKLYLFQFLDMINTKEGHNLILSLLKSQLPSGGFPSKFDENIEGIKETCRNVLLLLACGIPINQLNIQAAVNFLLNYQTEQGGWTENPKLSLPKTVVELSTKMAITWLTADIVTLLRRIGLEKNEQYIKALNWLKNMQNERGSWPMFVRDSFKEDPDSTAQILFLMREIYGTDNPIWRKGIVNYERFIDDLVIDIERGYCTRDTGEKVPNDIYHLTHLLLSSLVDTRSRIEAGYDLTDIRVQKIVEAIIDSQTENGGWIPFWSDKTDPIYSVLTLKLFVWLGVINKEDLRKQLINQI
ncbi:MAG: terpene cyclase/mutase family protein [Candidatus Heimdallarchaeota archaeon]|nr:MAG: terpene cyclase/mutase family protein [Candidatus Heimdallarchaeota archaeon]